MSRHERRPRSQGSPDKDAFNYHSDERDFESLPPALRRKYFSTVERLRLAQHVHPSLPLPPKQTRHFAKSKARQTRSPQPRLPNLRHHPSLPSLTHRKGRRLQRAGFVKAYSAALQRQVDARWFSSLPPKIQQQHFSREERSSLSTHSDCIIVDAADETLQRRRRQASLGESITSVDSFRSTSDSAVGMADSVEESFRWLDDEDDLDLALDEYEYHTAVTETYHTAVAQTTQITPAMQTRRMGFHRNLSLSSLNFRRSSISMQPPTSSVRPVSQSLYSPRPVSALVGSRQHRSQFSMSSIDPAAKHYQDPESRLKLRVYLASPQKFDEAIEFGFPALDTDDPPLHAPRPKTNPRVARDLDKTFFVDDDTPSLSNDEEDEDNDHHIEELEDPRTPQDSMFEANRLFKRASSERSSPYKPRIIRGSPEPYAHTLASNREMTLHMTLTRPDLRSADEPKLPPNINDQPLERERLMFEDEPQFAWDATPAEGSKFKRLWRRLRLK